MRTTTRATATNGTSRHDGRKGGAPSSSDHAREAAALLQRIVASTADEAGNIEHEAVRRAAEADLSGDLARRDTLLKAALICARIRAIVEAEVARADEDSEADDDAA